MNTYFVIKVILSIIAFTLILIKAIDERKKGEFDEILFTLRIICLFVAMK